MRIQTFGMSINLVLSKKYIKSYKESKLKTFSFVTAKQIVSQRKQIF